MRLSACHKQRRTSRSIEIERDMVQPMRARKCPRLDHALPRHTRKSTSFHLSPRQPGSKIGNGTHAVKPGALDDINFTFRVLCCV